MGRLRRNLTFANVCSFLALTIAVSTGGAYAANTVFSTDIVDGEVKTVDLGPGAVTSAKIKDLTITGADLADSAVGSAQVAADSLTAGNLAPSSVGSDEIATDAVQATEIADDSIDGGEIIDNTLGAGDLASSAVGNAEIATGAVTNTKVGANAIDGSKVASNSLTAFDLAGGEATGNIGLPAGYAANGRCRDGTVGVPGAKVGDAVIFSVNGTPPPGILFYGVRVPADGQVTLRTCNLTGGTMPAFTNLPVAIVTITI